MTRCLRLSFVCLLVTVPTPVVGQSTATVPDQLLTQLTELRQIADGWPSRVGNDEERRAAEELWAEIEAQIQAETEEAPTDFMLHLLLGDCYRMGHNLDIPQAGERAVDYLKKAVALNPADVRPHLLLGQHYSFANRPVEGEAAYLRAIELHSSDPLPAAYFGLTNACYFQKRFDDTVKWADKYLAIYPSNKSVTFIKEKARAALRGEFEPRTVEIDMKGQRPDGKIKAASDEDEPKGRSPEYRPRAGVTSS